jgi:hypothetical protein
MSYPLILYELHYVHSPVVPGLTTSPILLYALLKLSFCLLYLFLVVLVCLLACMLGPDACVTLEGARSKSLKI